MRFSKTINNRGFTLFELMISMTVFSLLMIIVFDAVANIGIARTKSVTRITLLEELYFFSEKLASSIKDGGIVDYEEYWNRQVVGTGVINGHYARGTGFGNYGAGGSTGTTTYGAGYYYCRSTSTTKVGTGGCVGSNNSDSIGGTADVNYTGRFQRYGQYKLQYTDYNGNGDSDTPFSFGDEDGNGNIRGDEDDKDIGDGPIVLSGSSPELYLYNPLTKERLFFRWTYKDDPNLPASQTPCNMATGGGNCLGNIEILRLKGKDIGLGHSGTTGDIGAFDGVIDTWVCHPDWNCSGGPALPLAVGGERIPTGNDSEWISLFPEYVSVRKLSFSIYPLKDPWRSWAAPDCFGGGTCISPFIQPYVRLQMTLGLAWEKRKLIRGDDPTIAISTTISLSDTTLD